MNFVCKMAHCAFCLWSALVKLLILLGHLNSRRIAHFRVAACLSFKASPGAQPFKWHELRILMQIKLISLTIVERQDSLQNRGKQQLGNGLFCSVIKDLFGSKASGECLHLNLEGSVGLTSN